jgi:hypothetical protein
LSATRVMWSAALDANAFSGVCADVVYRVEAGSFAQYVVFTGWLDPAALGFDPATVQVQVFSEFYGAPRPERTRRPLRVEERPEVRQRMVSPDLVDEVLEFGQMVIGTGRAFTELSAQERAVPIGKAWVGGEGERTFLVETFDYALLAEEFEGLPDCRLEAGLAGKGRLDYASLPRAGSGLKGQWARIERRPGSGVVVDYVMSIGGATNTMVFQADTTYFLSSAVICSGTVTIEGGTVLKFPTNSTVYLQLNSTVLCRTSPTRPAFFTGADDDLVGDKLSTGVWPAYTGIIKPTGYGNPALWAYYIAPTLQHLRFRHCQEALRFEGTAGTLLHSQLANCIRGIVINGSGSCAPTLNARNTLIADTQHPLTVNFSGASSALQHCTVDTANRLVTASSATVTARNSVFASIATNSSGTVSFSGSQYNGFYQGTGFGTVQFGVGVSPFQGVGAGGRYLAAGSSFRNAGVTSGIDTGLFNELKGLTTHPPLVLTQAVTTATVLAPQAQRDADTPDLGYHYPSVDYAVSGVGVEAALTADQRGGDDDVWERGL